MSRIAVVGDVMLDAYYTCDVTGFSPEDDLAPKLRIQSKLYRPGGAANVACCLRRWGAEVGLFGITGDDFPCETLSSVLRKEELERVYLPALLGRPTTCKTRLVTSKSRQIVRMDEEQSEPISESVAQYMAASIREFKPDALVVSDYAKGVVTEWLMDRLHQICPLIVVDPKRPDFLFYGPVFAITPNVKEFQAYFSRSVRCLAKHLIVTKSEEGSIVLSGDKLAPAFEVPTRKREIGDPAGCGDAFLAALVYSLCGGKDLRSACLTASAAGALAFDMLGVACPSWMQVEQELRCRDYVIKEVQSGES